MRVVHVVTAFPRSDDDVITPWLVSLIAAQRESGLDVSVLAPAYRGLGAGTVLGVPVRRFRYAPRSCETLTHDETVPDRLRRSPAYASLVPLYVAGGVRAGLRLGRERPDVIHVHWPVPHALIGAAARSASVPGTPAGRGGGSVTSSAAPAFPAASKARVLDMFTTTRPVR